MKIEILPLAATLALYAQWKFASPFLPNPTLRLRRGLVRHTPLILFGLAGVLLSVALENFSYVNFILALLVSITMMFTALGLAYRG